MSISKSVLDLAEEKGVQKVDLPFPSGVLNCVKKKIGLLCVTIRTHFYFAAMHKKNFARKTLLFRRAFFEKYFGKRPSLLIKVRCE